MRAALIAGLMLVAACGDDRPPAPTPEESDQLNEAEDLLNQEAANQEGPGNRSPGPSD